MHNGYIIANQRLVSYRINPDRTYSYDRYISTKNRALLISEDGTVSCIQDMPVSYRVSGLIRGIEDVRVYSHASRGLIFLGTVVYDDQVVQVLGSYPSLAVSREMLSPYGNKCEKNWVFYDDMRLVYSLNPFILMNYDGDVTLVKHTENISSDWRGSTSYIRHGDEMYAVVHVVRDGMYRHAFARVDATHSVSVSSLFSFENADIEYCLGFTEMNGHVLLSYSIWDKNTKIKTVTWDYVFDKFNISSDK